MSKKGRKVMCLAYDDQLDKAMVRAEMEPKHADKWALCEKAVQLHEMLHKRESLPLFRPVAVGSGTISARGKIIVQRIRCRTI